MSISELIASKLRSVPDFPTAGILFKDISPLLADGAAFGEVTRALAAHSRQLGPIDLVAGIEARGFMIAAALANELNVGLLPVRKAGKLPPPTERAAYVLEYGTAEIEVPVGLVEDRRVLLVDDVLATGGTMVAAADLIERARGRIVGLAVLLELADLPGRQRLAPREVTALLRA